MKTQFMYYGDAKSFFRQCIAQGKKVVLSMHSGTRFPYTVKEVEQQPKIITS